MAGKNTPAFGLYSNYADLESAVENLRQTGFRNTDISVLFQGNEGNKDLGVRKQAKAPERTATGAARGTVVGGALGWLAGIGALTIPGLGPFLAAGPIVAALTGAGAAGVADGIAGGLIGLGIPKFEAKRCEGRIKKGGILLSIYCDNSDWTKQANQILEQTGAEDVPTTSEAGADYNQTDRPMRRTA